MPKAVVVVPCFDEARRLDVAAFVRLGHGDRVSVLFVDDGSRDATPALLADVVETVGAGAAAVLTLPRNVGKAEAVRRGLRSALDDGAAVVGYLDADLATPVDEFERLVEELERTGAEGVLGARVGLLGWEIERRLARQYLGRVFATVASLTIGLRVYDTQCGAKVFRRTAALERALDTPFRSRWVFDVELLGRLAQEIRRDGRSAEEVLRELPLERWREVGGSKLRPLHMACAVFELRTVRRDVRLHDRAIRGTAS